MARPYTRPKRGERGDRTPTWPRFAIVVAVFVVAFFVARGCQEDQVRVSEEQAVSIATEQVDFRPDETQIRLLRQGLDSSPYWFVVLSEATPKEKDDAFARIAQFKVDANTGEVSQVSQNSGGTSNGQAKEKN